MSGILVFGENDNTLGIRNFDPEFFIRAGAIGNEETSWSSVKALYR